MKHIIRSKENKTVLSVQPGRISITLGSNFNDERLRDFLKIIDGVVAEIINDDVCCFGHFVFSKNRVNITLSDNPFAPNVGDLTYRRNWK